MYLPRTSEYALRVMTELTYLGPNKPATAARLSRLTRIERPYLAKVLRRLVLAGLLRSQRGEGGGFRLACPPSRISFSRILVAAGYPFDAAHCIFGWKKCGASSPCPLHPAWKEIKKAFDLWAKKTFLSPEARREVR